MQNHYNIEDLAPTLKMLKLKDVAEKCKISRSTIYDKLDTKSKRHDEEFPKPYKLGMSSVAWLEKEVEEWLKTRPKH